MQLNVLLSSVDTNFNILRTVSKHLKRCSVPRQSHIFGPRGILLFFLFQNTFCFQWPHPAGFKKNDINVVSLCHGQKSQEQERGQNPLNTKNVKKQVKCQNIESWVHNKNYFLVWKIQKSESVDPHNSNWGIHKGGI